MHLNNLSPPHTHTSPLSFDKDSNIRLRHKLSSVRLSKLKKAPPLEGKAEELAPKIPLITVTVADPSGKSADVVDLV